MPASGSLLLTMCHINKAPLYCASLSASHLGKIINNSTGGSRLSPKTVAPSLRQEIHYAASINDDPLQKAKQNFDAGPSRHATRSARSRLGFVSSMCDSTLCPRPHHERRNPAHRNRPRSVAKPNHERMINQPPNCVQHNTAVSLKDDHAPC